MIRIQLERREEHHQDTSLGGRLRATRDRLRERAQSKDSSPPGALPAPGGRGRDRLARNDTEAAERVEVELSIRC